MRFVRALPALFALALSPLALAAPCAGFTDADDASSFCASVEWMRNRGITLGCATNLYCPAESVNRLQLAVFLDRMGNVVFQQGGNAFGATAVLGTIDQAPVEIHAA